ncbi:MAG: dipeptide epimerase [Elusimicrobia bacterium]|nr:dipeptide epimerase [Elusimicrobiota bacterium]
MRTRVRRITVGRLDAPMKEPFGIAGGAQTRAANVLVRAELDDGTVGWGEGAPMPAFNGVTQAQTLSAARAAAAALRGAAAGAWGSWKTPRNACARAAVETALLDAWTRRLGIPLRVFFGGAEERITTDITIPIVAPEKAADAARGIRAFGVRTLKIKVGKRVQDDAARVLSAMAAAPSSKLMLDANAGYSPADALRLLARLRSEGVEPELFEQPTPAMAGLREVRRKGRVPVAADESADSPSAVMRLAAATACDVVNIKVMKLGLLGALETARVARACGFSLMIGGLVETRLGMTAAAHLACGLGRFAYADLDTPLFLAEDPMRGVPIGRGGVYDLSKVRSGIGVSPR